MRKPLSTAPQIALPPLRSVRIAHGLGLREVAKRAQLDPAHLSRVERGQAQLSVESLARLADVLGLHELARLLAPYLPTNDEGPAAATPSPRKDPDGAPPTTT